MVRDLFKSVLSAALTVVGVEHPHISATSEVTDLTTTDSVVWVESKVTSSTLHKTGTAVTLVWFNTDKASDEWDRARKSTATAAFTASLDEHLLSPVFQ